MNSYFSYLLTQKAQNKASLRQTTIKLPKKKKLPLPNKTPKRHTIPKKGNESMATKAKQGNSKASSQQNYTMPPSLPHANTHPTSQHLSLASLSLSLTLQLVSWLSSKPWRTSLEESSPVALADDHGVAHSQSRLQAPNPSPTLTPNPSTTPNPPPTPFPTPPSAPNPGWAWWAGLTPVGSCPPVESPQLIPAHFPIRSKKCLLPHLRPPSSSRCDPTAFGPPRPRSSRSNPRASRALRAICSTWDWIWEAKEVGVWLWSSTRRFWVPIPSCSPG